MPPAQAVRSTETPPPPLLATIDADHLARDPVGEIRREEHHHGRDILGRAQSLQGDVLQKLSLSLGAHRLVLPLRRRVREHEAGSDIVDRDVPGAEFVGELSRQAYLAGLGAGIGLNAGQGDAKPGTAGNIDDPAALLAFMPGATACDMKKAPERLTSTMTRQSSSEISSMGRPT